VVHGHHEIGLTRDGQSKTGLGTQRPHDVNALRLCPTNGRRDALRIFTPEQAIISGMRIEPADDKPTTAEAQLISQCLIRRLDGVQNTLRRHRIWDLAQWNVHRDERYANRPAHKRHHGLTIATKGCQEVGMAREGEA
jgi:hypothetical protein